jgi:hypothetical protein
VKYLVLCHQLILCMTLAAQPDSIPMPPNGQISDGVYRTWMDFRFNRPIPKEAVVSDLDKSQLEFLGKVLSRQDFSYKAAGTTHTISSNSVFGYFQNNTFYINYEGEMYRVPVFGSLSFFVANVKVARQFYDPRFGLPSGGGYTYELREFLFDYYSGVLFQFSQNRFEELLKRDPLLFKEYMDLRPRKRRDQLHQYVRKFNSAHPVYFLKAG